MNKLTAESARQELIKLKVWENDGVLTEKEERHLQALEIALPILEQQERGESEWIEWGGGEQPVGDDVTVETKWSDGSVSCGEASDWRWDHLSLLSNLKLIAYRLSAVGHWIEWTGSVCCPVAEGTPTEVKFRNGRTDMDDKPEFWDWNHTGVGGDIIAYRIIPEQPTNQNGEQ